MDVASKHKLLIFCVLTFFGNMLFGQKVDATIQVRQKLVQIGKPFEVELSVRHPEHTVVIFPDSSKDFKPYEVKSSKTIFTSTQDGLSEDGMIYQLYTWEIDSLQSLQFPVRFITDKGDTGIVSTNQATVEFLPMIPSYNDTLPVRIIGEVAEIKEPINWAAWGVIISVSLLLLIVAGLVFAKPLRKWFRRMQIDREFRRHLGHLDALRSQGSDQPVFYPGLNRVWRHYFDRQWSLALGAMTTTELRDALPKLQVLDENDRATLLKLSQATDLVLYAERSQPEDQTLGFWNEVKRIMLKEYQRRKEAAEL